MKERALLVASGNPGKVAEIAAMLADVPVPILGLSDFPPVAEPDETGLNFADNAAIKASYYARQAGIPALSDDSGLEVRALGGAPGIYSARYGGAGAPYESKIAALLAEITASGIEDRSARFVCAAAVADADGRIVFSAAGECRGLIARAASGTGGFGYDPVFVPEGFVETFGELPAAVKDRISHRGRALRLTIPFLREFFGTLT